jgi:hypothetical protein
LWWAVALLYAALRDTKGHFKFEIRSSPLRVERSRAQPCGVDVEANKPVPEKMPYTVTWGSLRMPGMGMKTDISRKIPPISAPPTT